MSQNISLWGASYSNVPSVTLPKTGGGTASFTDVTDTTATASDVASGKYFYTAAGVKTQGTSTSGGYITQDANGYVVLSSTNGVPTLKTKSITANGTYNASSDNANGYSSVTVNVSGGGSMNATTNCETDVNTWQTLTVSNVQNAPSKFVLVYDYLGESESIITYGSCIYSAYYDGTSTDARYVAINNGQINVYKLPPAMGALTWSYNSNSHILTFTANGYVYFNDSSVSGGFGYTLYYS